MKRPQPSLFELDPAPWDLDDAGEQLVAAVVFPRGPQRPYDYAVADALRTRLSIGQRVRAPLAGTIDRAWATACGWKRCLPEDG